MNTPEPNSRGERILKAAAAAVAPLYPARRVLSAEGARVEEDLERTEQEVAARRREAEQLLEEARTQARKIVTDARRGAKTKLERSREEGLRAGAEQFAGALLELQRCLETERRQAAFDARRLGLRFAKAILDVEFTVRPERVIDLVESLLRRVGDPGQLEVRLHPRDAALVRPQIGVLRERIGLSSPIRVVDDEAAAERSVRVESRAGAWDGGVEIQLAPLLERLGSLERVAAQSAAEVLP